MAKANLSPVEMVEEAREAAEQKVEEVEQKVEEATSNSWVMSLARLGYATKGFIYIIVGGLAAKAASGGGEKPTDNLGAIEAIYKQPLGRFLLVIVALGLFGYAMWSFIRVLIDTTGKRNDAHGIVSRLGYLPIGFSYAGLAFAAAKFVAGSKNGGQTTDIAAHDWTAHLLKEPFGMALVVVIGLVVIAIAVSQCYEAYTAKFKECRDLSLMSPRGKSWLIRLGRFGLTARSLVFAIIGIFFIVAALRDDPSQAKGLGGAFLELAQQPFGHLLLGGVAFGFIAYGIFSLAESRYNRICTM